MMNGKFKENELLIDYDVSWIDFILQGKTIEYKNAVKVIREDLCHGRTNVLLKMNCISKELIEALTIGNDLSLVLKNNFRNKTSSRGEEIKEEVKNIKVVYSYKPRCGGIFSDYIFVLSTDENLSYDMIMKLVEREEKQQLNSSIYKNRPLEVVAEIKNVNGNLENMLNTLDKSFNDFKKEVVETMKI